MNFFIEKLKISNFLSFFGEFEVNLKPFSAVMCNYYEGKDDLFRAFEFVFGSRLIDLRVEKPVDLVHKVLREEFLINCDIHTFVELTLNIIPEKKQLKFCRSVVNGFSNPRIEYKISDLVTSSLMYNEKLNSLGLFIQKKKLIFYKNCFDSVIWGSSEDLEMTLSACLRENYLLEDWKKACKKVEHLTHLKSLTLEKNFNSMKKSHFVLANFTKKYEVFSANRETVTKEILRDLVFDSFPESTSLIDFTDLEKGYPKDLEEKIKNKRSLEARIDFLNKNLNDLKVKEAVLTSHLYHEEIKLAAKPVNASLLQNRITQIKSKIQEKEIQMSEIWEYIQTTKLELKNLSQKISFALISFQEMQNTIYHQNRFTSYGRFRDYFQPSRYLQYLKQIIGNDIFYAHLCDSFEEASALIIQLKNLEYEHREVFIPFENYSHKLKDLLTASGEKGIPINTLEELLIFLCKLNQYHFIDQVPVIVQKQFNYEKVLPNDYTVYIQSNIHFTKEGLICYRIDENEFSVETEEELKRNLTRFYTEEELNYQKWNDLLFLKWETLVVMNSLENDVFCLKTKWRKSTQKPHLEGKLPKLTEIYEDYSDIFKEYEEERQKCKNEFQGEESYFTEGDSSRSSNEDSLNSVVKNLEDVVAEKKKVQKVLLDMINEIRLLDIPIFDQKLRKCVKFQNNVDQKKLFFDKELKKLKKLMKDDDLKDFLANQEWRKTFITSLIKDFEEIKSELLAYKEKLQNIAAARKKRLYQLFDHCNRYISSTVNNILGDALPFVKINFGAAEENIHIFSCLGEEKINVVDMKHFNTLLKFISTLAIFLEIAIFDKIPLMILDDIEEYFPIHDDSLETILGVHTLEKILPEKENSRFHLLIRLGQFLGHYIKKNIPGNHVRNNGNFKDYTNGPTQIIYFAKEDLVHAAEHCLWIQNKLLPEEYLSESCTSYSELHEINYNDINPEN